jgi:anti-sigma factor RsiW
MRRLSATTAFAPYWYDGPFSYALAGEIGRSGLASLAEAVYRQIAI